MTQSIAGAVQQQQRHDPVAVLLRRKEDFFTVLPSHVKPEAWLRMAEGALKKSPQILNAASNDVGQAMRVLLTCASLGHIPGSDRFYLVPTKGKLDGWESYRGVLTRILNTGKYQKVVAEAVYEGEHFKFNPNTDEFPDHEIDYMTRAVNAKPIMSYAYCVHLNGTNTKVAIADPAAIARSKAASMGASGANSPWSKYEEDMVIKVGVKKLEAFTSQSTEDLRLSVTATATRLDVPLALDAAPAESGPLAIEAADTHRVDAPEAAELTPEGDPVVVAELLPLESTSDPGTGQ
ncbi:hypothetical protein CJ179_38815 [Rhodococcus sp. ACS1]|uniref:recombinase RecT n=1 Tax=Rhodococcus sp. ACS1 TaxID=2028570 RepID=UPI000BB130AF|nr:recombinase RecT [Rhodococcus sp. ACS1]PBC38551.1 hypothetical protein CJ179_38815 [Rhodococcus sp. ACS1]